MYDIFYIISIWIIILPAFAGLINYRRLDRDSRWIFLLVLIATPPQLMSYFINSHDPTLNLAYNIYSVIEFGILALVFERKFHGWMNTWLFRRAVSVYFAGTLVFFVIKGVSGDFINELVCLNNGLYMIWILFLLKEQYDNDTSPIRRNSPFAWYLLGVLIYAPCTIIVFALYHYIRNVSNPLRMNAWIIQSVCNILMYMLFTIGLFISRRVRTH